MEPSLETKAMKSALLAASVSVVGAWLLAWPIQMLSGTGPGSTKRISFPQATASPELVEQGRQFYNMSCSHCHAEDAHGGEEGPDLHNLAISNSHIAIVVKKGIKGEMPSFAKKYDKAKAAALVSYLRTLK
jgi:mono/diheme cytochrome c family protein